MVTVLCINNNAPTLLLLVGLLTWLMLCMSSTTFSVLTLCVFVIVIGVFFALFTRQIQGPIPLDAHAWNMQCVHDALSLTHFQSHRMNYAMLLFDRVVHRWVSPSKQYLREPGRVLLQRDFAYYWERPHTYMDSYTSASLYALLLLDSKLFSSDEIQTHMGMCSFTPHGYVLFKIKETKHKPFYADVWAARRFADTYCFGQYAKWPCVLSHNMWRGQCLLYHDRT